MGDGGVAGGHRIVRTAGSDNQGTGYALFQRTPLGTAYTDGSIPLCGGLAGVGSIAVDLDRPAVPIDIEAHGLSDVSELHEVVPADMIGGEVYPLAVYIDGLVADGGGEGSTGGVATAEQWCSWRTVRCSAAGCHPKWRKCAGIDGLRAVGRLRHLSAAARWSGGRAIGARGSGRSTGAGGLGIAVRMDRGL